jgi:hypothetical protein
MIDIPLLQPYVSLFKDIFSIISTIILAVIAIIGLQTWKKQLKGKTEYELARRLLRAVYETRDAIKLIRNPFASASEISAAVSEAGIDLDPKDPEFYVQSQSALYQRRWKKIEEAMADLDLEAFEAEVIWGNEVKDVLMPLRQQVGELHSFVELYLRNLNQPSRRLPNENMLEKIDKAIYDFHDLTDTESDNPFTAKTSKVISKIEDYLRPRIKL